MKLVLLLLAGVSCELGACAVEFCGILSFLFLPLGWIFLYFAWADVRNSRKPFWAKIIGVTALIGVCPLIGSIHRDGAESQQQAFNKQVELLRVKALQR